MFTLLTLTEALYVTIELVELAILFFIIMGEQRTTLYLVHDNKSNGIQGKQGVTGEFAGKKFWVISTGHTQLSVALPVAVPSPVPLPVAIPVPVPVPELAGKKFG